MSFWHGLARVVWLFGFGLFLYGAFAFITGAYFIPAVPGSEEKINVAVVVTSIMVLSIGLMVVSRGWPKPK